MANEGYAECLVKRKTPGYALAVKLLLGLGIAVAAASVMFLGVFGFIALVLMGMTAFYVYGRLNVEYEYLLADGQFTVDRIFNKSGRKQAAEYSVEDMQAIGPEEAGCIKDMERQVQKVIDFSSGRPKAKRYAFVSRKNGVYEKVLFEPDEKMIKCFKSAAPRRFSEY